MSLTVDDAKIVSNLRLKMVQNMQADKPAADGIDKEQLKEALDKIRKSRSIGAASGKKASAAEVIPIDLNEFMKGIKK